MTDPCPLPSDSSQLSPGPCSLDHHFARFLTRRSGLPEAENSSFELLVKRLSAALTDGHSCLPVTDDERRLLNRSPMVSQGITTPLVLCQDRLYLQRYFRYEWRLAEQLKGLAKTNVPFHDCQCDYQTVLNDCFGADKEPDGAPNLQRRAAEMAMTRPLALISGGPGTGKTSTVARILGLLLLTGKANLQIALSAPTGKAAMRLREAIAAGLAALPFSETIRKKIPTTASTLHRLLGVRHNSPHFRHNQTNPLPWDVVVVDEASMVDLALMSKLVDALKPASRLILLGDKDQLASVESGAVLADCITALPDSTVILEKSYRFNQEIYAFARAVNHGDSVAAWEKIRRQETGKDFVAQESLALLQEPVIDFIVSRYIRYMEQVMALPDNRRRAEDIRALFASLNRFRVLCATRRGPGGVESINWQVEQHLARCCSRTAPCRPGDWYPGRPVMILNNDYTLNLFNGDVGICLPDPAAPGRFKVWFEREDSPPAGYQISRLPANETVFAMTIHKSQGSEFAETLVVLPASDSPLLSRELIYTAITRARDKVIIATSQEIFHKAVTRTISRASGLYKMLTSG